MGLQYAVKMDASEKVTDLWVDVRLYYIFEREIAKTGSFWPAWRNVTDPAPRGHGIMIPDFLKQTFRDRLEERRLPPKPPPILEPPPPDHDYDLPDNLPMNDSGNATRLVLRNGHRIRWVADVEQWIICNGRWWPFDENKEIQEMAKAVQVDVRVLALRNGHDPKLHQRILKWSVQTGNAPRIRGLIELATSQRPIQSRELDKNPWLFNCDNGTLDLRTGTLRPHAADDWITKCITTPYEPEAKAPKWETFIGKIMGGPGVNETDRASKTRFLQQFLGYCLTGTMGEQCVLFLYGLGQNGKSALVKTITNLLGDYVKDAQVTTFEEQRSDKVRSDLARLRGARLVTTSEGDRTDDGQIRRISEGTIKKVTGGEPVTARFLYQRSEFSYNPEFKLLWATNHKPVLAGVDEGIWRRVRLLHFAYRIPDAEKRDLDAVVAEFLTEAPGILAWLVRGCLDWQRESLIRTPPPPVIAATQDYRDEMNVLNEFFESRCDLGPGLKAPSGELYGAYTDWAKASGERHPFGRRGFAGRLQELGYSQARGTGGARYWLGLSLHDPDQARLEPGANGHGPEVPPVALIDVLAGADPPPMEPTRPLPSSGVLPAQVPTDSSDEPPVGAPMNLRVLPHNDPYGMHPEERRSVLAAAIRRLSLDQATGIDLDVLVADLAPRGVTAEQVGRDAKVLADRGRIKFITSSRVAINE